LKMEGFPTLRGSWSWPWIGSYCIPLCITHRLLIDLYLHATFHWNQRNFCVRIYRQRTFETHFSRSTQKSQP